MTISLFFYYIDIFFSSSTSFSPLLLCPLFSFSFSFFQLNVYIRSRKRYILYINMKVHICNYLGFSVFIYIYICWYVYKYKYMFFYVYFPFFLIYISYLMLVDGDRRGTKRRQTISMGRKSYKSTKTVIRVGSIT